jgi:hypothetical protein
MVDGTARAPLRRRRKGGRLRRHSLPQRSQPWLRLASDTTLLAMEAQTVINLRLGQSALGRGSLPRASSVSEKLLAWAQAATTLATGGSPHQVVRGYRKKVRANTKRLRRA